MELEKKWKVHSKELKERGWGWIVGIVLNISVALYTGDIWINRIVLPFLEKGIVIQYTDPWESLQGYLYIVLIISFILSLLVSQNHTLAFLNPGLIGSERLQLKQCLNLLSFFIVVSILYIWWFLGPLSIDWVLRFIVDGSMYVPKYLALTDRIFQLMVGIGLLSLIPIVWVLNLSWTQPLTRVNTRVADSVKKFYFKDQLFNYQLYLYPKIQDKRFHTQKIQKPRSTAGRSGFRKNISQPDRQRGINLNSVWKHRSRQRKWLWIILFSCGAIVTPPDFFSLFFIVGPLLLWVEILGFYFLYKQVHLLILHLKN